VRKSTRGRWRALTLTLVYLLFALHYLHWHLRGRTLTPVEPSEGMQTLEQGLVNAGFIFFAAAIASTLLLGRWFCGWGCHLVALQDLSTWLLKKLGLRPKPFRSRLLRYVPLLAALYMYVWPSILRAWHGAPRPAVAWQLTTEDFWATFPGPWMSVLTFLVCGFLIIYLLGNKGFCTYACPYGGFFGVADRVAPGKIRVTDACDGCGHCTATCTSNVRVHEEVRLFGMVVDPGCMKCTDCISVCPKNALYFGFGRPTVAQARPRAPRPQRAYDYSWPEEAALAALFLVGLCAFRGLYAAVPFLLSLGLAAILAFLLLEAARLFYVPSLQLHHVSLRHQGRITPAGGVFLASSLALAAFVGHSVLVQYHAHAADHLLDRAAELQASGTNAAEVVQVARQSLDHLTWLERYGLFPAAKTEAQLGAVYLFVDSPQEARGHLQRALQLAPTYAAARYKYAELIARGGDLGRAVTELERAVHDDPALADARRDLIAAARRLGRLTGIVRLLDEVVRRRPQDSAARLDLATVLAETGDVPRAATEIQHAREMRPDLRQP
jgi:polyferredoxin